MTSVDQIKKVFQQLYPTGRAWNHITNDETREVIEVYTDGVGAAYTDGVGDTYGNETGSLNPFGKQLFIAESNSWAELYENALSILNQILPDNDQFDETDASNWERVLGLFTSNLTLEERKESILRKKNYPNGIPERAYYLFVQEQLRAAGFDVYVHENRFADGSGGWDVVDPEDLVSTTWEFGNSEFGIFDFGGESEGISYSICANYLEESRDNQFYSQILSQVEFGNFEFGVGEFQNNENLERETGLRYTFFIGAATFPNLANVPTQRKDEFRQLVLTLKHQHILAFLLINYN